jgi:hypothetical protein
MVPEKRVKVPGILSFTHHCSLELEQGTNGELFSNPFPYGHQVL